MAQAAYASQSAEPSRLVIPVLKPSYPSISSFSSGPPKPPPSFPKWRVACDCSRDVRSNGKVTQHPLITVFCIPAPKFSHRAWALGTKLLLPQSPVLREERYRYPPRAGLGMAQDTAEASEGTELQEGHPQCKWQVAAGVTNHQRAEWHYNPDRKSGVGEVEGRRGQSVRVTGSRILLMFSASVLPLEGCAASGKSASLFGHICSSEHSAPPK